ncbi:serine hydrolase domain-containing protein [Swaminathania salitolerans]|uniref:Esterase n=1 Tax=Swaminathania salitolerans TaxID=182838 RepID=A0A511BKZ8_9PROT|nr:beta-lactamase [Swaminathania salitolerans LMG 21291]GEL01021.1 esterase [Swaminathania salitolerans]
MRRNDAGAVFSRRLLLKGGSASALLSMEGCATRATSFAPVDRLARDAVASGQTPGVVVAIGHRGRIVHRFVHGDRARVPHVEGMSWGTRFDMASLTKPTMTALAIMQLEEEGLVSLEDRAARYLPEFALCGKTAITLRMLLTHYSGLPPDLPLDRPWQGRDEAVRLMAETRPSQAPGEGFLYSDINYIALGFIVERVSGRALASCVRSRILVPLGMTESGYCPDPALRPRIAPTQFDGSGLMLRGIVHDPTARRMGGVAGHAGLFSDAHDMTTYAQALLDRLAGRESRFPLRRETLARMIVPQQPRGKAALRGLGWDIDTHYSSARGKVFSRMSFGHTGFTGTSLWIDPASDSYVLILTNRVHPRGGHSVVALRRDVATQAALALRRL